MGSLLGLAAGARAADEEEAAPPPHLNEGEPYQGVAPGAPNLPPRAPKLPITDGPQRLTWAGFQLRDGVPTVFLELTGRPEYTVEATHGALVVTLKNTVAPLKNNRRPLRVAYFNTAVKDVETREKGRDLKVVIHTAKGPAPAHREHVESAAGGFQLLVIEVGRPPSGS